MKKLNLIYQNNQLDALITMHTIKTQNSNYKFSKIRVNVENFGSKLGDMPHPIMYKNVCSCLGFRKKFFGKSSITFDCQQLLRITFFPDFMHQPETIEPEHESS